MRIQSIRELLLRRRELKTQIREKLEKDKAKMLTRTRQGLNFWAKKIKSDEELSQAVKAVGLTEEAKVLAQNLRGRDATVGDELNFEMLKLITLGKSVALGKKGKELLQKEFRKMLRELEILFDENPENEDLGNFLLEMLIWSHNPDSFIQVIKEQLSKPK